MWNPCHFFSVPFPLVDTFDVCCYQSQRDYLVFSLDVSSTSSRNDVTGHHRSDERRRFNYRDGRRHSPTSSRRHIVHVRESDRRQSHSPFENKRPMKRQDSPFDSDSNRRQKYQTSFLDDVDDRLVGRWSSYLSSHPSPLLDVLVCSSLLWLLVAFFCVSLYEPTIKM
jgi:hypothetical protein